MKKPPLVVPVLLKPETAKAVIDICRINKSTPEKFIAILIGNHLKEWRKLNRNAHRSKRNPLARLTAREIEVVKLHAQNKTLAEVGKLLGISSVTAAAHRREACRKMGITETSYIALIIFAWEIEMVGRSSQNQDLLGSSHPA